APAAREVLDAASVVPRRLEGWLADALVPSEDGLQECIAAGVLVEVPGGLAFRHELARMAIEEALPRSARAGLNRRALAGLSAPPEGVAAPARLAHHAEAAGLPAEVLRHAPAAAARAAALGAHREAVAQYARALRVAEGLPLAVRVELLEGYAQECLLTG